MAACGVSLQRTITTSSGNVAQIGFLNNLLQKLRPIILRKGIEVGAECLLRPCNSSLHSRDLFFVCCWNFGNLCALVSALLIRTVFCAG